MSKTRDQPGDNLHADAGRGCEALRFHCEIDRDAILRLSDAVTSDSIPATVTAWPRDIQPHHIRIHELHDVAGEVLESDRLGPEVPIERLHDPSLFPCAAELLCGGPLRGDLLRFQGSRLARCHP